MNAFSALGENSPLHYLRDTASRPNRLHDNGSLRLLEPSHGLSEEEAVALVANGFVREVLQHLPMEFAVEAQKQISLEGSLR